MVHADVLFFNTIDQCIIGRIQGFSNSLQLTGLDVLCAALDLHKTFTRHITSVDLKHTDKVCLPPFALLSDLPNIHTDAKILLDFLFHIFTPSGLNLVQLGLFYERLMI